MCKCHPAVPAPFCGAPGCEWPRPGNNLNKEAALFLGWSIVRSCTGRPIHYSKPTGRYRPGDNTPIRDTVHFDDWKPDKDRNQLAMFLQTAMAELGEPFEKEFSYEMNLFQRDTALGGATVAPEQILEKALKAISVIKAKCI